MKIRVWYETEWDGNETEGVENTPQFIEYARNEFIRDIQYMIDNNQIAENILVDIEE